MLEIFVSNGLELGKKGTSLFIIFASIMFLLAVLVLISMLSGPISKKDKKEGVTHLIFTFLLFYLFTLLPLNICLISFFFTTFVHKRRKDN